VTRQTTRFQRGVVLLLLASATGSLALLGAQAGEGQKQNQPQNSTQPGTLARPPLKDGEQLFREKGCSYCHGLDAAGTEKAPSLLTIGSHWNRTQIERQIREGGKAMPAFGDALEPAELSSLADYLASKHGVPSAKTASKRTKGER
jgi:mono/diheme cytochrome c family protein